MRIHSPPCCAIRGAETTPSIYFQSCFVRPENLLLVDRLARVRLLAGHDSETPAATDAVWRKIVRHRHDVEAFRQQRAEAVHREDRRLIRRRFASRIDAHEHRSISRSREYATRSAS